MKTITTYRIFGIPVWSVVRYTDPLPAPAIDKESLYKEFSERFGQEMTAALRAKGIIP